MQPRPMTPTSGTVLPSVVVCMLLSSRSARGSVGCLAPGQAHLLDIKPGLYLAQDDVVDAALVTEPEHGGALVGQYGPASPARSRRRCFSYSRCRRPDTSGSVPRPSASCGIAVSASSVARISAKWRSAWTDVSRGSRAQRTTTGSKSP